MNMKQIDAATLALLGIYYGQHNGISIDAIDHLIKMATDFEIKYPTATTDWQDQRNDWADTVAMFYNNNRHGTWRKVPMAMELVAVNKNETEIFHIGTIGQSNKFVIVALHDDEYFTTYSNDRFTSLEEIKNFARINKLIIHTDNIIAWQYMRPLNKLQPITKGRDGLIRKAVKLVQEYFSSKAANDHSGSVLLSEIAHKHNIDCSGIDDIELGSEYYFSFPCKENLEAFIVELTSVIW